MRPSTLAILISSPLLACPPLPPLARSAPACFSISLLPGQAFQFAFEQTNDLRLRITTPAEVITRNAFDFGTELLTLHEPGEYRIELLAQQEGAGPVRTSVTRRPLARPRAILAAQAEKLLSEARADRKLERANRAVGAWTELADAGGIARAHLLRGGVHLRAGSLASAEADYLTALRLCRPLRDTRCVAEAANNAGLTATQMGESTRATANLEAARQAWRVLGDASLEAITLSNLGLLRTRMGDLQKAMAYYGDARRLLSARGGAPYGRVLNNLALCQLKAGDVTGARRGFAAAIPFFERTKSAREALRARSNLALTLILDRHYKEAEPLLEKSEREAEKENDRLGLADVLLNRGRSLLEQKRLAEAREVLERNRALLRDTGAAQEKSTTLHLLGLIAAQSGDRAQAIVLLTEAAQLRRTRGLRDAASASLFELALLHQQQGQFAQTRLLAEEALSLVEAFRSRVPTASLRASYLASKRRLVDLLVESGVSQSVEQGFLAAEKARGRVLLDVLAESGNAIPPALAASREELRQQFDFLLAQLNPAPGEPSRLQAQADALVTEDAQIEAQIRESWASTPLGQPLRSLAELQSALPAGAALVYFHLGERKSFAWRIDAKSLALREIPARAALQAQIGAISAAFHRPAERRASAADRRAFQESLAKLSATLLGDWPSTFPERLLLALDGPLLNLPTAALGDLGLRHDITIVPNAAFVLRAQSPRTHSAFPASLLAVTDPVFSPSDSRLANPSSGNRADRSFARLPFTFELDPIRRAIPATRLRELRGFSANLDALAQQPAGRFGVIHFSTHGWIDEANAELSGIALSALRENGQRRPWLLSAGALRGWKLDGSLVVLSACESASGRPVMGEGLNGLTNALLQAGAAQVLATLAKSDAEASSHLLAAFYRRLLATPGLPPDRALRLARQQLAATPRWADPFYWASFQLSGQAAR